MAEPTLGQVFGSNATQNSTDLVIKKSDLAAVGLVPASINSAESLAIAMILLAQQYLNDTNQANNIDQSISISIATTPSFVTRDNTVYIRDSITLEIDKLAPTLTINPGDY